MTALTLFDRAFRKNEWLAERQSAIAANIANANTPNFRTKDVAPFEAALDAGMPLAVTNRAHMTATGGAAGSSSSVPQVRETPNEEVLHSGNDVDVEKEFMKSGEVMRNYSMNTQVLKTFHRMLLMSGKV